MKKILSALSVLLAACLLLGALSMSAGAASHDVGTLEGFLEKLILDGNFYDYDCSTIGADKKEGEKNFEGAMLSLFSFPSCIDLDIYDQCRNAYGLSFAWEKNHVSLPLPDAQWLFENIFNWPDSAWEEMLSHAQANKGYVDSGRRFIYIKNGKLYGSGGDRGDWPYRLETVAKRQNGSRVEVVLNWFKADEYQGPADILDCRIYAEVEQKNIDGKDYWTVYRTKKLRPDENPLTVGGFTDVYQGDYYADAVVWAVTNGITSGAGDNGFNPGGPCTRAQIVTFLWRAAGQPEPTGDAVFRDVPAGGYYSDAVRWAVEKGITSGSGDGNFSPENPCTRAQAVTFLWRAAGKPAATGTGFGDVEKGSYYEEAVKWAVEKKVTSGTGNGFSPDEPCSRGQIVTFLYRAQ